MYYTHKEKVSFLIFKFICKYMLISYLFFKRDFTMVCNNYIFISCQWIYVCLKWFIFCMHLVLIKWYIFYIHSWWSISKVEKTLSWTLKIANTLWICVNLCYFYMFVSWPFLQKAFPWYPLSPTRWKSCPTLEHCITLSLGPFILLPSTLLFLRTEFIWYLSLISSA